jgi:hypothetical protein
VRLKTGERTNGLSRCWLRLSSPKQ